MFTQIITRAKALILSPKTEWEVIDGESVDMPALYKSWVIPLAAIPSVAGFIGTSIIGGNMLGMHYRVPLFTGLTSAILSFVVALAGVFVFAHIISFLAPYFGAQKNLNQAFKVSAYAPVAAWLSGVFQLIPALSLLAVIGAFYSLYLLFVGLPVLMNPPKEKGTAYTIVAIISAIVLSIILGTISASIMPNRTMNSLRHSANESASETRMAANRQIEDAAKNGNLGGMLAAISGGSTQTISDLAALENLAPDSLGGLERTMIAVESKDSPVKIIILKANYAGENDRHIDLQIMNSVGVNFIRTMTGMAGNNRAVTKEDGSYEKLFEEDGVLVMQDWDAQSEQGSYAWSHKNFIVAVKGNAMSPKALKRAAHRISTADLDRLPKA